MSTKGQRAKGHIHKSSEFGTEITYWCTQNHSLPNQIAHRYKRLIARVRRLRTQWRQAQRKRTFNRIASRRSKFAPPVIGDAKFIQAKTGKFKQAKTTGERLVEILGPEQAENLTDRQLEKIAHEASHFRQETGTRPAILSVESLSDDPKEG